MRINILRQIELWPIAAALTLLLCGTEVPATAQESSPPAPKNSAPSQSQIDRWIVELGDESYAVRQSAAERLVAAGSSARASVVKWVDSADPEVRAAARRIVSLIESSDLRRRLDAFAADTDGSAGLTLPGWDCYQKLVGSDPQARALFVEMQRHDAPLIAAAFRDPPSGDFEAAWEERLGRIMRWQMIGGGAPPATAGCATLVFLACGPTRSATDQAVDALSQLIHRSPLQDALRTGEHRDALRRLVAAWIVQCPNYSESSVQQRLNVASAFQLSEAVPLALAVAAGRGDYRQISTTARVAALLFVAHFGDSQHLDAVEPLLDDTAVCFSAERTSLRIGATINSDVEIRDVALVVLLQLTNQRAVEYGYLHAQRPTGRELNPELMFPRNDEQRLLAMKKWREWRAERK